MIYLIIILVVIWVGYFYSEKHDNFFLHDLFSDSYYGPSILNILLTIALVILITTGGIIYFCSIGEIAEMEAFHNEICATYEQTIEKSEDITINAVERAEKQFSEILDTGNLAYFELAKSVNTNLQELRDKIRDYNNCLYSYRRYNANWFTDSFVPSVPEYLKPIKMK